MPNGYCLYTLLGTVDYEKGIYIFRNTVSPTSFDQKLSAGNSGLGNFTLTFRNLKTNANYFYKAYSITKYGTAYGKTKVFYTLP